MPTREGTSVLNPTEQGVVAALDAIIAERDQLKARCAELQTLAEQMHGFFYNRTHPGEPCRQSGHVPESMIRSWEQTLYPTVTVLPEEPSHAH